MPHLHKKNHGSFVFKAKRIRRSHLLYQYDRPASARVKKVVRCSKHKGSHQRQARDLLQILSRSTGKNRFLLQILSKLKGKNRHLLGIFSDTARKNFSQHDRLHDDEIHNDDPQEIKIQENDSRESQEDGSQDDEMPEDQLRQGEPNDTQNVLEPIQLRQRAILRRRYQAPSKLVALHKVYQDGECLANEELELATAGMDLTSLESIGVRLGIRAFYQE